MPITLDHDDRVATLTIERTHRRNALDLASLDALHDAVVAAVDGGARALVLTGADGHFCAGADLVELEDDSFTSRLAQVLEHLAAVPVTTVAAIDGSCMGLGMQLAVACDVRVVGPHARFAVPIARLGLMVDHWTIDRVRRFWGEGAARHLLLTGAVLGTDDAWRLGFAQVLGGRQDAQSLAQGAAALAPLAQAGSKVGFDTDHDDDDQIACYKATFAAAWASQDLLEGRRAFAERRPPTFRGN